MYVAAPKELKLKVLNLKLMSLITMKEYFRSSVVLPDVFRKRMRLNTDLVFVISALR